MKRARPCLRNALEIPFSGQQQMAQGGPKEVGPGVHRAAVGKFHLTLNPLVLCAFEGIESREGTGVEAAIQLTWHLAAAMRDHAGIVLAADRVATVSGKHGGLALEWATAHHRHDLFAHQRTVGEAMGTHGLEDE